MNVRTLLPQFGRIPDDPLHGPRSGIVHTAIGFARALASSDCEVILTGWSEESRKTTITPEGAVIYSHPGWPRARIGQWDLRWLLPHWINSLRHETPDVLHVYADVNLLRLRARRRILHLETPIPDPLPESYLALADRADAVISCSAYLREQFVRATGIERCRVHVIPNGTDTSTFQPVRDRERAVIRHEWSICQDAIVVLFAGALRPEKGLIELLRAARQLHEVVPTLRLLVLGSRDLWSGLVGPDPKLSHFDSLLKAETTGAVRFLGSVDRSEITRLYAAADVVAVPSLWEEPFGLVALDALASGLPVVASRTGGLPEIVDNGLNGILVPPGDVKALTDALLMLCRDRDLRKSFGNAGRQKALHFDWHRLASQVMQLYGAQDEMR